MAQNPIIGNGLLAGAAAVTPPLIAAPSDCAATRTGPNTVRVTWQDNSNNETAFFVEAANINTPANFGPIGIPGANATFFDHVTAPTGVAYFYRVRAFSSVLVAYSAYSNVSNEIVP